MAELEKVKKGFERCLSGKMPFGCGECPYYGDEEYNDAWSCRLSLMRDALALLKEDCHNCKLECLLQKYDELKEKYDALLKEQEDRHRLEVHNIGNVDIPEGVSEEHFHLVMNNVVEALQHTDKGESYPYEDTGR